MKLENIQIDVCYKFDVIKIKTNKTELRHYKIKEWDLNGFLNT